MGKRVGFFCGFLAVFGMLFYESLRHKRTKKLKIRAVCVTVSLLYGSNKM